MNLNDAAAPKARLTDAQRLDWLRLIRSENVGPRTFRSLINHFGGAGAALEALPDLAQQRTGRRIALASVETCETEYAQIRRAGAELVALGEPDYPPALRAIDAPPPLLTVRGKLALLAEPAVAIVGSRNASASGLAFTESLAREIGRAGHVIVSGLARGVDARAHRATLATGTIAVLAGGFGRIYPSEHVDLAEEIAAAGVLVSEMPFMWEPRGRDFPRRNRIVSGLSLGTVVVEAARRSGSLITARFALEQGREVFAVPGSPLDPRAEGTNDLLRQGATFCTSAADVVAALEPLVAGGVTARPILREAESVDRDVEPLWDETDLFGALPVPLTSPGQEFDEDGAALAGQPPQPADAAPALAADPDVVRQRIIDLLGPSPVSVDELVRASLASPALARATLLELELAGRLERHGGNLVSLIVASVSGRSD